MNSYRPRRQGPSVAAFDGLRNNRNRFIIIIFPRGTYDPSGFQKLGGRVVLEWLIFTDGLVG